MAFDLVRDLKGLNGSLRGALASIGGANSPEMRGAGKVLAKQMKRVLSIPGGGNVVQSIKTRQLHAVGGRRSSPGEPPRAQTGQLSKSITMGVVGTGLRVGPLRFYGGWMESGISTTRGRVKTRQSGRRRGNLSGTQQRTLTIKPRPFLGVSIDLAASDMAGVFGDLAGLSLEKNVR